MVCVKLYFYSQTNVEWPADVSCDRSAGMYACVYVYVCGTG